MKRPLQAILIAGEDQKNKVLTHKKNITIRTGHRDYIPGTVILCCHILNWATMRRITSVRHTQLKDVEQQELLDDGFTSRDQMLSDLQKYYPDLAWDSDVTIVRWDDKTD